jgi:hypothetical protein
VDLTKNMITLPTPNIAAYNLHPSPLLTFNLPIKIFTHTGKVNPLRFHLFAPVLTCVSFEDSFALLSRIHTYMPLMLYQHLAEASQIFFRDTHVLIKFGTFCEQNIIVFSLKELCMIYVTKNSASAY